MTIAPRADLAASPAGSNDKADAARAPGRHASLAFLAICAACLFALLAQSLYPALGTLAPPVDERRQKAPFPDPALLLDGSGSFAEKLNAWFNDRAAFRDLFIRAKNQIDYSAFNTSRRVVIGKDGWLFNRSVSDFERLNRNELSELEQRFDRLAQRIRAKGWTLIVIGYPDKSAIYPEMTPPGADVDSDGPNSEHLRSYLAANAALTFIDAEAILKAEKSKTSEHIYSKVDTHATVVGQLPVVKEIVRLIALEENRPEIVWRENFQLGEAAQAGIQARAIAILKPVVDDRFPYFTNAYAIGRDQPDGVWSIPDRRVFEAADDGVGRPFDWEFRSNPELCPARLPGLAIFGNSFSDLYWSLGLQNYFCFARRARDPASRINLFIDTLPAGTKYFIYEYYLPRLLFNPPPAE